VANVEVTAGVREHGEGIVLGLAVVDVGAIETVGLPSGLPPGFDLLWDVFVRHGLFSWTV
jgi:hypothetical protein